MVIAGELAGLEAAPGSTSTIGANRVNSAAGVGLLAHGCQLSDPASRRTFQHALCVYPYRRELNEAGFFPPLGLELITAVMQQYARSLDLVDLHMVPNRTLSYLRPQTDLVCFSINWDRDREFLEGEIRSVPPGVLTVIGGRHATEDPGRWLTDFPNVQPGLSRRWRRCDGRIVSRGPFAPDRGAELSTRRPYFSQSQPQSGTSARRSLSGSGCSPSALRRYHQGRSRWHRGRFDRDVARLSQPLRLLFVQSQSLG